MYRYVCSHCLRTFLDEEYDEEKFCWKCGEGLEVIPKKGLFEESLLDQELVSRMFGAVNKIKGDEVIGYICSSCAKEKGATWPEGHVCTMHNGKCDFCGLSAGLCHTSDYDWPSNPDLQKDREF